MEKTLVSMMVMWSMIDHLPGWTDAVLVAKRGADPVAYAEMYDC